MLIVEDDAELRACYIPFSNMATRSAKPQTAPKDKGMAKTILAKDVVMLQPDIIIL